MLETSFQYQHHPKRPGNQAVRDETSFGGSFNVKILYFATAPGLSSPFYSKQKTTTIILGLLLFHLPNRAGCLWGENNLDPLDFVRLYIANRNALFFYVQTLLPCIETYYTKHFLQIHHRKCIYYYIIKLQNLLLDKMWHNPVL